MLDKYLERGVIIWQLNKNYETKLREEWGEKIYQDYCNKFSGYSKAVRARLFAIDETIPIPKFVEPIIKWIAS